MKLRFILSETFQGLRRNLTMTFAVIITVAVSLTSSARVCSFVRRSTR